MHRQGKREKKKKTKNIAQLIKWKGNDTAKSLIEELKQRYPRKPALLDELRRWRRNCNSNKILILT